MAGVAFFARAAACGVLGFLGQVALQSCFLASLPLVEGLRPLNCPARRQLFATYDHLLETQTHFLGFYGGYSHGHNKDVPGHVKAFQLHALAQDFLEVINSFRRFACLSLCPQACADNMSDLASAFSDVQLVEKLNNLQLDLELLVADPDFLSASQQYLREAKQFAAQLLVTGPQMGGEGIDWDEAEAVCVARVGSRVLFPAMQVISLDSKQNESHIILNGVTTDTSNPASSSASYIAPALPRASEKSMSDLSKAEALGEKAEGEQTTLGELSFGMLRSLATSSRGLQLSSGPGARASAEGMCAPSSPYLAADGDSASDGGWPRRWRLPPWGSAPAPMIVQLLEHIEASRMELSHSFIVLRPAGDGKWAKNFSCEGTGAYYDPSLCLEVRGWGGYVYSINVHPPYRSELRVAGKSLGDATQAGQSTFLDVLHPYGNKMDFETVSIEHMYHRMDFLWRQASEPSPDLFFLHPATHNCHAVEYLFSGAPLTPKVLVIPINPLIPPPFEVIPHFESWMHLLRPALRSSSSARGWVLHGEEDSDQEDQGDSDSDMDVYLTTSFWLGQCSLSAVEALLKRMAKKRWRYLLHHVDGAFAVFVRKDLQEALSPKRSLGAEFTAESWYRGWYCSPASRFFARLEVSAGPDMAKLGDPTVANLEKEATLCRFLDRQNIPVQQRNFDCQRHLVGERSTAAPSAESNCVRPDSRGWGNDGFASETVQDSTGACEAHCQASFCTYWTFDPTSMYGQPLCWIWIGARPAEMRSEKGWISGDEDCRKTPAEPAETTLGEGAVTDEQGDDADYFQQDGSVGAPRELFNQWAVKQLKELPGMRYFLEAGRRGRCVHDFCECFPPYRGPLCEQTDAGSRDRERNFTGVLHYLTSDDDQDIEDISHSLPRLWRRFNRKFDYPVVIFNDGLSEEHRRQIVNASKNRIWFAYVDDYLQAPDFIMEDPSRKASLEDIKWSMGYRGMCRFRSGTIFLQPVLQNFEYAMTLDTDGYFPAEVAEDPIAAMAAGGYIYTFSHLLPDLPGAVRHFWEYSLLYMRMKEINPVGTKLLRQFVREEDLQWTHMLYMNDIEITQLAWFRSDPYQDYFRYLDSIGGFWLHRWGDHAVRTIAVAMWLPEEKVYEMDLPYGHQNYCRCSNAAIGLACVREGDVGGVPPKWWICAGEETRDSDS